VRHAATRWASILLLTLGACDSDGDGFKASEDCDDEDEFIHPAAPEVCDSIDNNCDGIVDFDECDLVFGPEFRITILEASTPYSWDGGAFVTADSRAVDMRVRFGTESKECHTPEVENSSTAFWDKSCTFTFDSGGFFEIFLYDVDVFASEEISTWTWAGPAELFDFGSQKSREYVLNENDNRLRYRIEAL
jgi:hypothetical protein